MSKLYPFEESETVKFDVYDCFFGKEIGRGMSRVVYEHRTDPTLVIKVEGSAGRFQNIIEAKIWAEIQDTKAAKWFAPVTYISACGSVMIMKKCEPIQRNKYPKKIPAFFGDRKYGNFGMLGKQLVCFDYGTTVLTGHFNERMVKANWWDE